MPPTIRTYAYVHVHVHVQCVYVRCGKRGMRVRESAQQRELVDSDTSEISRNPNAITAAAPYDVDREIRLHAYPLRPLQAERQAR